MAGIYIHIPSCKKKCSYCNFFMSTCLKSKEDLISAEIKELKLQKKYLNDEIINTIYFGGGTPSLLEPNEINLYIETINKNYKVSKNVEITLECNPEDININKLKLLKELGINRLSIGIQTFNEKLIKFLNRSNSINDIYTCLENIKKCNFNNFNIDLIFGIQNETKNDLIYDLEKIISFNPTHISCYCLTIEPKTLLNYKIENNLLKETNEDILADQFEYIHEFLTNNGYIHYEISNYCKPNYESKHNSSYWNDEIYLGIGPSAHSYNRISRQFNTENIYNYINSINQNNITADIETLTEKDKINDYIFTHLRTNKGIDLNLLKNKYNYTIKKNLLKSYNEQYLNIVNNKVILTLKGMLISNMIIKEIFL